MINANELRIGNWVNFMGDPMFISSVDQGGVTFWMINSFQVNKKTGCTLKTGAMDFMPIPLTPEILLACGFKNIQGDYWMKDNDLMIAEDSGWWWTNSWEPDGEFGFDALATYREIESLHQLQNLYFCLTGSELQYQSTQQNKE